MDFLYQDEDLIVIDKPPGYHVHPPEDDYPVPRAKICLYRVRDTLKQKIFPVHRLDVATSGILLFARSSEMAGLLARQFSAQGVRKTYWAVARGYTPEEGHIDLPLESDSSQAWLESHTLYQRLATLEIEQPVGKRFPTARYSLLKVQPQTGRFHQIRRHFNRISHPLVGDGTHGDSHHNRFFRERLGIAGLCLRAARLEITHPRHGQPLSFHAPVTEKWVKIQGLFKDFDLEKEAQ
jgi:tRNA pseudouridine65 synthase